MRLTYNIKVSPKEILNEKKKIKEQAVLFLCKILQMFGANSAAEEVKRYGMPKQILVHRSLYELFLQDFQLIIHTITPLDNCSPQHIELNWSDTRPNQNNHIAVIAYDIDDFIIWMDIQGLSGIPRNKNKRIQQINDTLYHGICNPDDLRDYSFDKIIKLNACTSNKYYKYIIHNIKLKKCLKYQRNGE